MILNAPKIDDRSGKQIFDVLAKQLRQHLNIDADKGDPMARALLHIFARYCELIIERLNKVPDKNRDAFLDVLNISRVPPACASVPLTFTPVKLPSHIAPIYVPCFAKVAASPGEGENEPTIFETTRDLALTNVELRKVLTIDPKADLYSDKSFLTIPEDRRSEPIMETREPVTHEFHLGSDMIFGRQGISELRLHFDIKAFPFKRRRALQWFIPKKDEDFLMTPIKDTTEGLSRSGVVVFKNLPEWQPHQLADNITRWLSCRLLDRLTAQSAQVRKVLIWASWEMKEGVIDCALFNNVPLDTSKDFFPLGMNPRFGDVFYLKSSLLLNPGTSISLAIKLTNPASAKGQSPIPQTTRDGAPHIQWEIYNGHRWGSLECKDSTEALTEDGEVCFSIPPLCQPTSINGNEGGWIRARLVAGNYGDTKTATGVVVSSPPSIQSVTIFSSYTVGPTEPQHVVTNNGIAFEEADTPLRFPLFKAGNESHLTLYLGFKPPENNGRCFIAHPLDLFILTGKPEGRACVRTNAVIKRPVFVWQYWNGKGWVLAKVDDETGSLTESGIITLRSGDDMAPWRQCSFDNGRYSLGNALYWFRAQFTGSCSEFNPRLSGLLLNTVMACQTNTFDNELLGASNGLPNQIFYTARVPVLKNLQLEVREPDIPSGVELEKILREEGDDALTVIRDRRGEIEQIWIRWHEVADFLSSESNDRHYIVERESGEIRFGDGLKGIIPPAGANNIRLRKYHTGGGAAGNKPAGSISQLRTTIPYVDSVVNAVPALGGQDLEAWDCVRERAACCLRHRGYAVTLEDYEDLAKMSSPNVAKARCYPNCDLSIDPSGTSQIPGVVSLIIVPHGNGPRLMPDMKLLRHVSDSFNERKTADAELVILAPEYICISVEAVVVPSAHNISAGIVAQCRQKLERYFHPVYGGEKGKGWEFGQLPYESELYALLEAINDLDHVQSLSLKMVEDRPGLYISKIFLVCSGEHRILAGV